MESRNANKFRMNNCRLVTENFYNLRPLCPMQGPCSIWLYGTCRYLYLTMKRSHLPVIFLTSASGKVCDKKKANILTALCSFKMRPMYLVTFFFRLETPPPPKKKKRKKKSNVAKVEKATQSHMTIHLNNCVGLNTMSYSSSEKSATRLAATSPSLKKIVSYSTQCSASLSAGLNLSLLVY